MLVSMPCCCPCGRSPPQCHQQCPCASRSPENDRSSMGAYNRTRCFCIYMLLQVHALTSHDFCMLAAYQNSISGQGSCLLLTKLSSWCLSTHKQRDTGGIINATASSRWPRHSSKLCQSAKQHKESFSAATAPKNQDKTVTQLKCVPISQTSQSGKGSKQNVS